jgi:hypothetical protein
MNADILSVLINVACICVGWCLCAWSAKTTSLTKGVGAN